MSIEAAKLYVTVEASTKEAESALNRFQQSLYGLANKGGGSGVGDVFKGILGANLLTSAASQLRGLAGEALDAYASFERLGSSLQSLQARELLNAGAANSMADAMQRAGPMAQETLRWVEQLAIKSPFNQEDVAQALRMAQAYGFTTEESKRLTQATIDFAAGSGATGAAMQTISLALGQIKAKGKLAGQEVLQLVNAGVAVDSILAKAFGKSTSEIVALREKGLIPADAAIEAIVQSLESDFGGAAARQSNTVQGLINSLEDIKKVGLKEFFAGTADAIRPFLEELVNSFESGDLQKSLREWGQQFGTFVKTVLQGARDLIQWWNGLGDATKTAIGVMAGLYVVGPTVAGTMGDIVGGVGSAIGAFGRLSGSVGQAASAFGTGMSTWNTFKGALSAGGLTSSLTAGFGSMAVSVGAVTVALAALVAVWITWNEEIVKTNQEGQKAVGEGWADWFKDQTAAGKDATQMAKDYIATQNGMRDALNNTNPVVRLFIANQQQLSEDYQGLSSAVYGVSKSYGEYQSSLAMAADANGLMIDSEGDLVRVVQDDFGQRIELVQANYMLAESEYAAAKGVEATTAAIAARAKAGGYEQEYGGADKGGDVGTGVVKTGAAIAAGQGAAAAGKEVNDLTAALEENQKASVSASDALSGMSSALQDAGWSADDVRQAQDSLRVATGEASQEQVNMENDVRLLNQALADHIISQETYNRLMVEAKNGTLELNDATRQQIQTNLDLAESYRQTTEAQIHQNELARSLSETWTNAQERYNQGIQQIQSDQAQVAQKIQDIRQKMRGTHDPKELKAYRQEIKQLQKESAEAAGKVGELADEMQRTIETAIASTAMGELNNAYKEGKISGDQYVQSVEGISTSFGLTNEQGTSMAAGIIMLTQALEQGTVAPETYGQKLKDLATDAQDGQVDLAAFAASIGTVSASATTAEPIVSASFTAMSTNVSASATAVAQNVAQMALETKNASQQMQEAFQQPDWNGMGQNISAGIAQGIRSGIGEIQAAATDAAAAAEGAANQEAEIKSPSHKLYRTGMYMMEGLKLGISENKLRPGKAMAQATRAVVREAGAARGSAPQRGEGGLGAGAIREIVGLLSGMARPQQPVDVTVNVGNEQLQRVAVRGLEAQLGV